MTRFYLTEDMQYKYIVCLDCGKTLVQSSAGYFDLSPEDMRNVLELHKNCVPHKCKNCGEVFMCDKRRC